MLEELSFLSSVKLFQCWNQSQLNQLYMESFKVGYSEKEVIYRQDEEEEPETFYIVASGDFRVQMTVPAPPNSEANDSH